LNTLKKSNKTKIKENKNQRKQKSKKTKIKENKNQKKQKSKKN
jgi:hypothetical protein